MPQDYPLHTIPAIVDRALVELGPHFDLIYSDLGRPSIPPEHLLRALLLQVFYRIRSERQLMEQMNYNLLFRWFLGLDMDAAVWVPTVFTENRGRLLDHGTVRIFSHSVLEQARTGIGFRTSIFRWMARCWRLGRPRSPFSPGIRKTGTETDRTFGDRSVVMTPMPR